MYEYFNIMTKTTDYLKYAAYFYCYNAWENQHIPTIHEVKEAIRDDGISDDIINRFLPESNLKKLSMNLKGIKLRPYMTLSDTLILPSDLGLVKAYIDWFHSECDRKFLERMVNDPKLREYEEKSKKGSPVFDKIWEKILKFKAVS